MENTILKTYTLDELKDEFIGAHGTEARDNYENELNMEVFTVQNSIHISHINTPEDYEKALNEVDMLMRKGEKNLTGEEMELLDKIAELVEDYEDLNGMAPIPRSKELAMENDRDKIAAVLGYEPDLIGLVEFKMYQLKMNQNGLAEMLQMPASKISQILNKKREPDVSFLKGIHEKLGIDGNFILEMV